MQFDSTPIRSDLVLIGGGHSHLFVLKYLAMNPIPGMRLTLITRDLHTPYSGMLPGFIAGHYEFDDAHIDLRPLSVYARARLIRAEVSAIDVDQKVIMMADRPPITYDLLSINIGSRPAMPGFADVGENQFAVKPIDNFLTHWQKLEQRILASPTPVKLAIVGAGAGGVELALSLQYRIGQALAPSRKVDHHLEVSLVTDDDQILSAFSDRLRRRFTRVLKSRNIKVHCNTRVQQFDNGFMGVENRDPIQSDAVIWVTTASAPDWLSTTGLKLDSDGFIAVNDRFQSCSHPQVFATGDIASVDRYPRPKSGVFAVRQGIPLAKNLARSLRNQPLKSFRPQKQFLSLISTGEPYAVAARGPWSAEGAWLWLLKNRIDRRFMRQFSDLPEMKEQADDSENTRGLEIPTMRCGGCGSKIGSKILGRVLSRLSAGSEQVVLTGLDTPDDAAIIDIPVNQKLVQSVDYFRSFLNDPFLFGKIATNHAINDLFAMGAEPHSAMAIASIPYADDSKQEEELFHLMSGAVECLRENNTMLVGGHSSESGEMAFGLAVNGFASPAQLFLKSGMQPGDCLILTRALGSGVLFAADMRRKAKARWIEDAVAQMLMSNRDAMLCLRKHGATACTDVSGFGLAGHLFEMIQASAVAVEIDLARLPLMDGALEIVGRGILSSLQPQNMRVKHAIEDREKLEGLAQYALLFDPQTAGGLLASVPADQAEACVDELRFRGYRLAENIARVIDSFDQTKNMRLTKLNH